jgi:hypothetical protein
MTPTNRRFPVCLRLLLVAAAAFTLFGIYRHLEVGQWLEVYHSNDIARVPLKQGAIQEKLDPSNQDGRPSSLPNKAYVRLTKCAIVAAQAHEDTSWAAEDLPEGWDHAVMVVDDKTAPLHTPMNKGREAGAYLWYILQNYEQLPDTMVFMHSHKDGHSEAWHVDNEDYSNPLSIQRLRIATVQENGFINLRCQTKPGCPVAVQLTRDPPDPDFKTEFAMPEALKAMFGMEQHQMPPVIAAPCCSQFAVSKRQIRARPKTDYERFWKWLAETNLDDAVSGRVFEYLWHIIFGRDPVHCPEPQNCYCENYGTGCQDPTQDGSG